MRLQRIKAADLVLTAGLAVVIGVVFTFWSVVVYPAATAVLGPIAVSLLYGVWFIGALIPAYIIRRPGIAFLGEFIAAHVELLTGSPYGPLLTYYGATQGLAAELVFAAFRYRRWDLPSMLLAGAAPALPALAMDTALYGYLTLPLLLQAALLAFYLLSGAVLGGWLSRSLAEGLARTGMLAPFPIARRDGQDMPPGRA